MDSNKLGSNDHFGGAEFYRLVSWITGVVLTQRNIPLVENRLPGRRSDHEVTFTDSYGALRGVAFLASRIPA